MHLRVLLLVALASAGCARTHQALRESTIHTNDTLADLNYQQVLNNVARFEHSPGSMPSVAIINAGTVTLADQKSLGGNATYNPTLTFAQQGGGALPILGLLFNPSMSRSVTENWSTVPVTDVDNLRRIRCAFQLLVQGHPSADCYDCLELLKRFYLGESDRVDCWIPRGWYHVGCEKDVPKNACHVGRYRDTFVWVCPNGIEGLARFTMTVIDLATGKPHAPMQSVVRTYKADGTLDSMQITTTEVDKAALERLEKNPNSLDRIRHHDTPPLVNPGYFFVPR